MAKTTGRVFPVLLNLLFQIIQCFLDYRNHLAEVCLCFGNKTLEELMQARIGLETGRTIEMAEQGNEVKAPNLHVMQLNLC